jgi:hypothetical protein
MALGVMTDVIAPSTSLPIGQEMQSVSFTIIKMIGLAHKALVS